MAASSTASSRAADLQGTKRERSVNEHYIGTRSFLYRKNHFRRTKKKKMLENKCPRFGNGILLSPFQSGERQRGRERERDSETERERHTDRQAQTACECTHTMAYC